MKSQLTQCSTCVVICACATSVPCNNGVVAVEGSAPSAGLLSVMSSGLTNHDLSPSSTDDQNYSFPIFHELICWSVLWMRREGLLILWYPLTKVASSGLLSAKANTSSLPVSHLEMRCAHSTSIEKLPLILLLLWVNVSNMDLFFRDFPLCLHRPVLLSKDNLFAHKGKHLNNPKSITFEMIINGLKSHQSRTVIMIPYHVLSAILFLALVMFSLMGSSHFSQSIANNICTY